MERTLDDSANRRLASSEAFLAVDAILELWMNITKGLVVHEGVVSRRVEEHLPIIASEEILMEAVKRGGDRQELHEVIRSAAMRARTARLEGPKPLDFLELLAEDQQLAPVIPMLKQRLDARRFTGRAAEQVRDYVRETVDPLLAEWPDPALGDEVSV
jgi:adenylosuccinate lyase